jgi:segregation and condensation protein A
MDEDLKSADSLAPEVEVETIVKASAHGRKFTGFRKQSAGFKPSAEGGEAAQQHEMPFAFVDGQAVTELPTDLYIPPDALEVFLEAFEGPLDLLLYLIKRQNIDILEINVAEITDQYMAYVELMETSQFELAAEYLVMAAMLAEIKSRMLLPRSAVESEEEDDPRAQLIRRLQEYERYKNAAEDIDQLPRMERDIFAAEVETPLMERSTPEPVVELREILISLAIVLRRADMFEHHHVQRETLSTREKMSEILVRLSSQRFVPLVSLLMREEGRLGVVVTFLAIMELLKDSLIEIIQTEPFGPIHLKARSA